MPSVIMPSVIMPIVIMLSVLVLCVLLLNVWMSSCLVSFWWVSWRLSSLVWHLPLRPDFCQVENTTRDPPWASSKPYPQILYQAESHAKDKHSGSFVHLATDEKEKFDNFDTRLQLQPQGHFLMVDLNAYKIFWKKFNGTALIRYLYKEITFRSSYRSLIIHGVEKNYNMNFNHLISLSYCYFCFTSVVYISLGSVVPLKHKIEDIWAFPWT